jgi:uncharacterized protein (TIGR03437 family)
MLRGFLLIFLFSANQAFGGTVQPLPALPNGAIANAVQVDSAGNIYVAGEYFPNPQNPNAPGHAIVGKLSPDGSQVIWWTVLAGSQNDSATALVLGSDNSAYVTGTTYSPDFPTTPGSFQPTPSALGEAFAAKLGPTGTIVYSTYIGGSGSGAAITVDPAGRAFITGSLGSSVFATTPGAVSGAPNTGYNSAYVIELDPTGSKALLAISGFGGNAIAVDPQGNIYAAGAFAGPHVPTTPGGFQTSSPAPQVCESSFAMASPCAFQHIGKIDPTGTQLIYATYISGSLGAIPAAIAIDAAGNAIVAGSTNSIDYPTTPLAYQTEYFAFPFSTFVPPHISEPPVPTGYVTKLNASGTGLIWSTYFGGSGVTYKQFPWGDQITGMGIDAGGNILVSGFAQSSDLPGLWSTPVALRPPPSGEGFVARLSPDGTVLSPTELVPETNSNVGIAVRSDGSAVVVPTLAAVSLSPVGRVTAISDPADEAKLVSVAPGQLLTFYGSNLATSANGVTVTFNGIPAPILYASGIQINVQVPYEISGQTQVTMQVLSPLVSPPLSESYILAVVERQPSVFISSNPQCSGSGLQPLALNADGTQNSCMNPAPSGSVVTIFLNGLGVSNPALATGAISPSAIGLVPAATFVYGSAATTDFLSTTTLPGSIDSLAQVQIQVSSTSSVVNIPVEVQQPSESPFLVRGPGILIWVRQ